MLWQVLRVEMASDDLLDCSTYFLSTSARLGKPNVGEHICVLQKVFWSFRDKGKSRVAKSKHSQQYQLHTVLICQIYVG